MSVSVTLTNTIYPRECLEEAIAAYSALCSVELTGETPGAREIEITTIRGQVEQSDESRVVYEFLNYLLDLSLEYHLQSA
jgi:hypothetical protein